MKKITMKKKPSSKPTQQPAQSGDVHPKKDISLGTKLVAWTLIIVLIANLILTAFRVYSFMMFWVVLLCAIALSWVFGFLQKK